MLRSRIAGPALVLVLATVTFTVMAFASSRPSGATERSSATSSPQVQAGETLFIAHCSSCHGPNGIGSSKAPALINAGEAAADFYLRTGRMPLSYPAQQALNHRPYFNNAQINAIVAYVGALPAINNQPNNTGPGIPNVAPVCPSDTKGGYGNVANSVSGTDKDFSYEGAGGKGGGLGGHGHGPCTTLSQGLNLFALNCAQCHDASGSGGMLSHGNLVPTLHNASATIVAEAIRVGPEPMPIFGPKQLSDQQVSAIVNYVQYLRRPADRGGLGIAHFGPVPEGFVGIVVGLFILLIFTRLVGTRE
jgi:ubiquinol-cytochrome c reductase cytochrome c subunit